MPISPSQEQVLSDKTSEYRPSESVPDLTVISDDDPDSVEEGRIDFLSPDL